VSFAGTSVESLAQPVPLGIATGLFFGKQFGVFVSAWLSIRLRLAAPPAGATMVQLYGVAVLCGIGFTMSLFIGLLAFSAPEELDATKLGVFSGSLASALVGWTLLRLSGGRASPA
jgi:NhaA family Na+:H+ antiporter